MKTFKIIIHRSTGQTSDTTYATLEEAVQEYDRLYHQFSKNESLYEWDGGKGFTVDDMTVELYWWNETDMIPNGFIGTNGNHPLIYLASPYTGNEEENFQKVSKKAAELMNQGLTIFSPIAMCHPVAVYGKLPGNWEFWEKFDKDYLSVCNKVIVYRLPGWEKSKGVQAEIKIAKELGIPIEYID